MVKKAVGIFTLAMIAFLTMPNHTFAAESSISSETIITEDNVYQVLDYLGLDASTFQKDNSIQNSNSTVGELEEAIKQANEVYKKDIQAIKDLDNKVYMDKLDNTTIITNSYFPPNVNITASSPTTGTKTLTYDSSVSSSYTITYSVSAGYRSSYWGTISGSYEQIYFPAAFTSSGYGSISIDSMILPTIYKIDQVKSLYSTYNANKVSLIYDYLVGAYVGVGDVGLILLYQTGYTGSAYWYASNELS